MAKRNVLIGCSGSVAAIKLNELIGQFTKGNVLFPVEVGVEFAQLFGFGNEM